LLSINTNKEIAAFDWVAYETLSGDIVVGLPGNIIVRAIADGRVSRISRRMGASDYDTSMTLEHGRLNSGWTSSYRHVIPLVETNAMVAKGQAIAKLYRDSGTAYGLLVHLHMELTNAWGQFSRAWVDPEATLYSYIDFLHAIPQTSFKFRIAEKSQDPRIIIANFEKVFELPVVASEIHAYVVRMILDHLQSGRIEWLERALAVATDPYSGLSLQHREQIRLAIAT